MATFNSLLKFNHEKSKKKCENGNYTRNVVNGAQLKIVLDPNDVKSDLTRGFFFSGQFDQNWKSYERF